MSIYPLTEYRYYGSAFDIDIYYILYMPQIEYRTYIIYDIIYNTYNGSMQTYILTTRASYADPAFGTSKPAELKRIDLICDKSNIMLNCKTNTIRTNQFGGGKAATVSMIEVFNKCTAHWYTGNPTSYTHSSGGYPVTNHFGDYSIRLSISSNCLNALSFITSVFSQDGSYGQPYISNSLRYNSNMMGMLQMDRITSNVNSYTINSNYYQYMYSMGRTSFPFYSTTVTFLKGRGGVNQGEGVSYTVSNYDWFDNVIIGKSTNTYSINYG